MHRNGFAATRAFTTWAIPFGLLATACFNSEDRCGEGQEYSEDARLCVCGEGFRLTVEGCEESPAEAPDDDETDGVEATEQAESDADEATESSDAQADEATDEPEVDEGPSGLGLACASSADCAGTEATLCDTFVAGICLVEGCELGASDCPVGYECQDLSMFGASGNVCVPATCDLAADDCPDGFTCCEPAIPGFPAVCLAAGCGD